MLRNFNMKPSATYIVSTVSSSLFVFKTMKILVLVFSYSLSLFCECREKVRNLRLRKTLVSIFHGLTSEPHADCYRRLVTAVKYSCVII